MELTSRQIKAAVRAHQRRVKQLQRWYDDGHPLVQWHLQQIDHLRERDRNQGGILAGGAFGASQKTTACPLMEGHG